MPRLSESDWSMVERDYRAGLLTDRQIAEKYGVSHGAIQKQAKARGWSRNLTQRIVAKAEEKVAKEKVANKVAKEKKLATEKEIVEESANALVVVMRGHHSMLGKMRAIAVALLEQLRMVSENTPLFVQVGELNLSSDDSVDKLAELYRKVISLPGQVDTARKLAEVLKIIIELERKVFKLDTMPDDESAKSAGAEAGRAVAAGVDAAMAALAAKVAEAKAK